MLLGKNCGTNCIIKATLEKPLMRPFLSLCVHTLNAGSLIATHTPWWQ